MKGKSKDIPQGRLGVGMSFKSKIESMKQVLAEEKSNTRCSSWTAAASRSSMTDRKN